MPLSAILRLWSQVVEKPGFADNWIKRVPQPLTTVYANVVQIQTTKTELVLDFGVQIPEGAVGQQGPQNFEPSVRVILAVAATRSLGEHMLKIAQQNEQLSQTQKEVKVAAEKG